MSRFLNFHLVYDMRVQATKEKDEAKSTTAKLIGNSSYGKDRVESFRVCSRNKFFSTFKRLVKTQQDGIM